MSKVLVDRGAAVLAKPAEAEVVEVVCYLRATQDGKPEWSEDCVCEDAVYPNYEGDETFSMPMVRQSDHLAALSAVTAERDRLRDQVKVLQSDANSWQSGYDKGRHDGTKHRKSEVDQLRAKVEALRKDAERYRWLAKRDRWASLLVDFDRNSTYRRHRVVFFTGDAWPQVEGQTIDEAVDAAIAAQGGE